MNILFFLLVAVIPITAECSYQAYHYIDPQLEEQLLDDYLDVIQPLNNAIFNIINQSHEKGVYESVYPIIVKLLEARSELVDELGFDQIDRRVPKKRSEFPH